MKNMKKFLKAAEIAAGAGLFLLNQSNVSKRRMRKRVAHHVDDLRDRARDVYEAATDRLERVSAALQHDGTSHTLKNSLRFAVGVGVGVGIALLFAPASGEQVRSRIADKAQEVGDNLRQRWNSQTGQSLPATGTDD